VRIFCEEGERRQNFRDFVRQSFMNGPLHDLHQAKRFTRHVMAYRVSFV